MSLVLKKVAILSAIMLWCAALPKIDAQHPVKIPKASERPITPSEVERFIPKRTFLQGCESDEVYAFQSVEIGRTDRRKIEGRQFVLYPVRARYEVRCNYAGDAIRAEVDLKIEAYQDDFGKWAMIDPGFGYSQDWQQAMDGVRCRVQSVAHLITDANGKVTGTTPAKDQGYIGCFVRGRNGDD